MKNFKEKFDKLVSKTPSKWLEEAKWRGQNRLWLKYIGNMEMGFLKEIEELHNEIKELKELLINKK